MNGCRVFPFHPVHEQHIGDGANHERGSRRSDRYFLALVGYTTSLPRDVARQCLVSLWVQNYAPRTTCEGHTPVLSAIVRCGNSLTFQWYPEPRRLHPTHGNLQLLASGPHRERYEELKAAYNLVRPEGSAAAPSYEEWRCISDICDHPDVFCR